MANIRILAVEDDPIYAETLQLTVEKAGFEMVGILADGALALEEIERTKPDLLLLDIRIAGPFNGIELARRMTKKIPVIFISSLREREIFEGVKDFQPFAFILKPFEPLMLSNTIELAVAALAGEKKEVWDEQDIVMKDSFFIREKNALVKVSTSDILYIEAEDKYCTLFTAKKKFVVRIALKDILGKVPDNFTRIHRSYAVDIHRINRLILEDYLIYVDDRPLPLGMSYKDELLSKLKKL